MKKRSFLLFRTILLVLLVHACSGIGPDGEGEIRFDFDLSYPSSKGYEINQVHATLVHQAEGTTVEVDLTVDAANNRASGLISGVRIGMWDLTVTLYENGTEVGSGTAEVEIRPGETTVAHITINLYTGSVEIHVEWDANSTETTYVVTAGVFWDTYCNPCYWLDTTRIDLWNYYDAVLEDVAVYEGQVYTTGQDRDARAFYCVNSARYDLDGPSGGTGIAVFNSIAYIGGFHIVDHGMRGTPCYWIGEPLQRIDLPAGDIARGCVYSIAVDGGTVYCAGYWEDNGKFIACYWQNGTRIDLPGDGTHSSEARGITLYDGHVYCAGVFCDETQSYPCYWVDQSRVDLPCPSHGWAVDIAVVDGTVYCAGWWESTDSYPCYWVDRTRFDLPVGTDNWGQAQGIAVFDGSVYTCGYRTIATTQKQMPCYWRDSVLVDLLPAESGYSKASAITVACVADQN